MRNFTLEDRARMMEGMLDLRGVVVLRPEMPPGVGPEARDIAFAAVEILHRRRAVQMHEAEDGTCRFTWAGSQN